MTAAVTTVANLSAAHFGHVIACNGWQGRLDIMSADRPGWVALTLAKADARRFAAYDRAADLWLAWKAADKDRATLEWQLDQANRDAVAHRDLDTLRPGSLVRTDLGWHRVVRVNRVSVSVATGYSWTDTVRLDRIIETRTGTA